MFFLLSHFIKDGMGIGVNDTRKKRRCFSSTSQDQSRHSMTGLDFMVFHAVFRAFTRSLRILVHPLDPL